MSVLDKEFNIAGKNVKTKWLGVTIVVLGLLGAYMTQFLSSCNTAGGGADAAGGTTLTLSIDDLVPADLFLGTANTFSVFGGGAGITNSGTLTKIVGDIGTTGIPGMITGFHDPVNVYTETGANIGEVTGSVYTAPPLPGTLTSYAVSFAVGADALIIYNKLVAITGGTDPGASQLGGKTLSPGVYKSDSGAFLLTGADLTLDGKGNPDSIFVFQMASSLTVGAPGAPRSVILTNGAQAKNVFWQVGSAATINGAGGGTFVGTLISKAGATISTAGNTTITKINGRIIGLFASVTMVNTVFNDPTVIPDPVVIIVPLPLTHITLSGTSNAGVSPYDITAVLTGLGYINANNNGGHVAATLTGLGYMDIVNNGAALTSTLTGDGYMGINNNGGIVTVTNTGNGVMMITNTGTGALTVSNTSQANITLTASGAAANTYTWGAPDTLNVSVVCAGGICTATPQ